MHNSVHMAKVTWNFTFQSTPRENAKLKCSEISTLQNRQIKMQLKYSALQSVSGVTLAKNCLVKQRWKVVAVVVLSKIGLSVYRLLLIDTCS